MNMGPSYLPPHIRPDQLHHDGERDILQARGNAPFEIARQDIRRNRRGQLVAIAVIESGFDRLPPTRRVIAFRMNEQGWARQLSHIAEYVTT